MLKKMIVLGLILTLVLSVVAQPRDGYISEGAQKAMARRAAVLDGYRLIGEMALGVKIDATSEVKDFVLVRDEINASFQGMIQGARVTNTRYMPDGTAEVDMELDLADLVFFLKAKQAQYQIERFQHVDFDNMLRYNSNRILRVTGTGARPDSTVNADQINAMKAENARLNQEVQALQMQIAGMTDYATIKSENSRLNIENSQLKQQVANYGPLLAMQQKYNVLQNENAQLKANYSTLESRYNTVNASNRLMEQRVKQATQDADIAKQKLANVQPTIDNLQRQNNNLQTENGRLTIEFQNLQQEHQNCATISQQYAQMSKEYQQLQQKNSVQESMLENMRTQMRQAMSRNEQMNTEYKKMQSDLATANAKLADMSSIYTNYQKSQSDLAAANTKLAELNSIYTNYQTLQNERQRITQQVNTLQSQMRAIQSQLSTKDQEIARLQKKLDDLGPNAWKNVPASKKAMARRAAILDAYRQLLESVKGIQISAHDKVENFVLQSSEIEGSVSGYLSGAQVTATRYLPDLTCEVDVQVDTRELVARLQSIANQYPSRISADDLNGIFENYPNPVVKATGMAAAQ